MYQPAVDDDDAATERFCPGVTASAETTRQRVEWREMTQ